MTKYHVERMLGGNGELIGPPPNTQFNMVVKFIRSRLLQFAKSVSVLRTKIKNEKGLNRRLSLFINNSAGREIFFANSEHMEDESRGDSPAVDIGIYLRVDDIETDPPLITVFEGKRLTTRLGPRRRQEYVIGHEKKGKHITCGGIERFKLSIHGGKVNHAGMIGYLQDGKPEIWQKTINAWISDLCSRCFEPRWSECEQLTPPITEDRVTECSSVVNRGTMKQLYLKHLWIDLVS
jgi:hypothetical protein